MNAWKVSSFFFSNFSLISRLKYFLQPLAVTKHLETLICVDALAAWYQKATQPPLLFHMWGTAETLYFSLTCRNVEHWETSNSTCGKWHVDLPFFYMAVLNYTRLCAGWWCHAVVAAWGHLPTTGRETNRCVFLLVVSVSAHIRGNHLTNVVKTV